MHEQVAGGPTVAERLRGDFEALTRAERQLADALLENYPMLGLESIGAVAAKAGVSMPTVLRMARKLGFAGFPDMQAALRAELQATLSNPIAKHDQWTSGAPEGHILSRFGAAAAENIRQTIQRIDAADFDAAVRLLADPHRNVHVVGGRITRALADYFFTHMQVVRPGVTLIASNANSWPHYVLNMRAGDVLVAFDIRRYEHDIVRLAEMAHEREVKLVLFTDQWGSPAAKGAAHSFHARIEAPSAWDSTVALMTVAEALIAAVETATWATTRERMAKLEELFDRTKLFRKFV